MSKRNHSNLISVVLTLSLVAMLALSGPASALLVSVSTDKSTYSNSDASAKFVVSVDIESGENVPIDNLTLVISGSSSRTCVFDLDGNAISGCENLTIAAVSTGSATYGNRHAQGWSSNGGAYSNASYSFGYGYGYGYGSGGMLEELKYNVTWAFNSSIVDGNYTANLEARAGSIIFKAQNAATFIVDRTPPMITSFTLSRTSPYIGDSLTGTCSATDAIDNSVTTSMTGISTTTSGVKTAVCTATDDAGNTATSTISYTVNEYGGGSSGSSGTTPTEQPEAEQPAQENIDTSTSGSWTSIDAGETTTLDIGSSEVPFTEIEFTPTDSLTDVAIVAMPVSQPDAPVPAPSVYKYIQIQESGIPAGSLSGVSIKFTVPRSWLEENGFNANSISLARWNGNSWAALSTSIIGSSGDGITFSASSPGLSLFAIVSGALTESAINNFEVPLFDIDLKVVDEVIAPNDKLMAAVSLKNLGRAGKVTADLHYTISDSANAVVYEKDESVMVETQYEFIREFDMTGMPEGDYSISASLSYAGQKQPAQSVDLFSIRQGAISTTGKFADTAGDRQNLLILTVVLVVILAAIIIFRKIASKKAVKKKHA